MNMAEEAEKMVVVAEGSPIDGVHETNKADDAINVQVIAYFILFHSNIYEDKHFSVIAEIMILCSKFLEYDVSCSGILRIRSY